MIRLLGYDELKPLSIVLGQRRRLPSAAVSLESDEIASVIALLHLRHIVLLSMISNWHWKANPVPRNSISSPIPWENTYVDWSQQIPAPIPVITFDSLMDG